MKTTRSLALVILVGVLLAGCEIYVLGDLRRFALESAQYRTEYLYNDSSVVCDDRTTQFEVVLRYRGEIEYLHIGLVGGSSGQRHPLSSFSPSGQENENGLIRRTFSVGRGVSPLVSLGALSEGANFGESGESVSSQSIIVVPVDPEIIGYTTIEVRIETGVGDHVLRSRNIPVFSFCN